LKDYSSHKTIELRLPRYLAEWLEDFANELAMDPNQLIANILHYYYEAYKKGFEKALAKKESESSVIDPEELAERFIKEKRITVNSFIIRKFASWIKENKINPQELNEETIESFLKEYGRAHNLRKTSYNTYKNILRKFVDFVSGLASY